MVLAGWREKVVQIFQGDHENASPAPEESKSNRIG